MTTTMSVAEVAAATEIRGNRRTKKADGHSRGATQYGVAVSPTNTSEGASYHSQPNGDAPLAGSANRDAANGVAQPILISPHRDPIPYTPNPAHADIIADIRETHRMRQSMIRARLRLELQAQATIRVPELSDVDFADADAKAMAKKRIATLYQAARVDAEHPLNANIAPFLVAMSPLQQQQEAYEKRMVKLVKQLPIYAWAKQVKGLGDVSLATLIGECGDIGSYKSVAAVWKRLGLAVMDGKRQGAPGDGATADDWVRHGYRASRRSVSWNARNQIIGGMGLWRPVMGDDLSDTTEYQSVFANRARYECGKLGVEIKCSDKGKESYSKHVINRAMRYTEKRMIKNLYLAWRRAA